MWNTLKRCKTIAANWFEGLHEFWKLWFALLASVIVATGALFLLYFLFYFAGMIGPVAVIPLIVLAGVTALTAALYFLP